MRSYIKRLFGPKVKTGLIPLKVINSYTSNPDFPFLVSFPRTGSHWLRVILETYTQSPLLPRSFFNHKKDNFLFCHTHDMELTIKRNHVIYLYRFPVDVIYSIMSYYQQDLNQKHIVLFWTHQYFSHLTHWWYKNKAKKQLSLSYDALKNVPQQVLPDICKHLNLHYDEKKMMSVYNSVNKETIKNKTLHDQQVVNNSQSYILTKEDFKKKYESIIFENFTFLIQQNNLNKVSFYETLFKSSEHKTYV